ncbi:MAG TPA: nucleotide exchange factor GrpE [Steroidobacteraceae bacterium]|nr:nucleotide exchange factor GrpE [Steroidobacteraceae bacterium]
MSRGELERASSADERDSAADPRSAMAQLEELQRSLTDAETRASSVRDQYLRSVAELDNVRKRAQRDVENATRYGLEKFAAELLPVMDSLQLAVASTTQADARSLAAGQEATLKLLARAFERLNIKEINPRGEPFDPARHEAVLAQESGTAEPNSVLQVVQYGYELNGRLLRPARVIVAKPLNRGDSHPRSGTSGDRENPSE